VERLAEIKFVIVIKKRHLLVAPRHKEIRHVETLGGMWPLFGASTSYYGARRAIPGQLQHPVIFNATASFKTRLLPISYIGAIAFKLTGSKFRENSYEDET